MYVAIFGYNGESGVFTGVLGWMMILGVWRLRRILKRRAVGKSDGQLTVAEVVIEKIRSVSQQLTIAFNSVPE